MDCLNTHRIAVLVSIVPYALAFTSKASISHRNKISGRVVLKCQQSMYLTSEWFDSNMFSDVIKCCWEESTSTTVKSSQCISIVTGWIDLPYAACDKIPPFQTSNVIVKPHTIMYIVRITSKLGSPLPLSVTL